MKNQKQHVVHEHPSTQELTSIQRYNSPDAQERIIRRAKKVKEIIKDLEESQVVTQDILLIQFKV